VNDFYRQELIHHAHKLGDAQIVIIHFGQQLAHQRIEHAFHRRQ
jgi:hypothetical protein